MAEESKTDVLVRCTPEIYAGVRTDPRADRGCWPGRADDGNVACKVWHQLSDR